ncbi:hypothetical protein FOA52_000880 [Chlamydomonas sp. UWO 241]|nr:hypothetical protein FOA52_000880 [Chlamydomonas sp. UWO 241]
MQPAPPGDGMKAAPDGGAASSRRGKEGAAPARPYRSGNEKTSRAGEAASSQCGKEGAARAGDAASSRGGKEGAAPAGPYMAWALAKLGHVDADFMDELVGAATPHLDSFNPQNLANMVWALATPSQVDADFMGKLLQVAKRQLGSFNPQGLANMAWALAALDDQNTVSVLRVDALIEHNTASAGGFTPEARRQLFQFSLWLKTWQPSSTLPPRLLADCQRAWLGEVSKTTESRTQEQVLRVIRQLPGCSDAISEHKTDDGLFSIGIAVTLPGGQKLAVEVDGPHHFLSNRQPDGATIMRNRLLEADCWRVVSVPATEWDGHYAKGEQAARNYPAGKLGL